jgi:glycosyltransferase involved in cell wall biosynthesis
MSEEAAISPYLPEIADAATPPSDCELLIPTADEADPEVTILVPALDEELNVGEFVSWCQEGLHAAGVSGEILIVDSSTDHTAQLALQGGARVLRVPRRGLGRAYIDAIPFVRGSLVIMGDADCTYDFRELARFVQAFRSGADFVMGSRWKGTIEAGAMPALHRYFGTPLTTWMLNRLYGSHFSDIHCGMRGITRSALLAMGLSSQSWEYASEMVLKSIRMGLRIEEVPVSFYKDRNGRVSHHKRAGWLSPFKAAWINLRIMFIYNGEFFALRPGLALLTVGLLLVLPLSVGPIRIGAVTFNLFTMLFGVALALLGLNSFFFGCFAQIFCDYSGNARRRWLRAFRYTRVTVLSGLVFLGGIGCCVPLVVSYLRRDFSLPPATAVVDHLGILGILFMTSGFSAFCFTLAMHATQVRYGPQGPVTPRSAAPALEISEVDGAR